ncbi:MAG: phosphoadenylyl-sulfate reductase [Taibaiella sp.]|jgi:phosphoadenosine phosphosulfate reductase
MSHPLLNEYARLRDLVLQQPVDKMLSELSSRFPGAVTFSTSFSYEDQVITNLIDGHSITIFTLDTGRLFKSSYSTWQATNERFGLKIKAYYPDWQSLESFLSENGPDSFYQSIAQRKQCCFLRKVAPLKRALQHQSVWIAGLRAEHSSDRKKMEQLEWDKDNRIIKYHPLLHWTEEEVKQYVHRHQLPYNILHDQGYASIGCEPCTRPIKPGEDFRAGRWWWEQSDNKECGLHHLSTQ